MSLAKVWNRDSGQVPCGADDTGIRRSRLDARDLV